MRSYPVWNIIKSCAYKSDKSYGIKEHGSCDVVVGTSRSNSHSFVTHKTTHRKLDDGNREYRFYVNDLLIKVAVLDSKTKELKTTKNLLDLLGV